MWVTVTESLCIPEEYAKDNSYAKLDTSSFTAADTYTLPL